MRFYVPKRKLKYTKKKAQWIVKRKITNRFVSLCCGVISTWNQLSYLCNMGEIFDIYSILDLEYGSSIDVIRSKMKTHRKNGQWNNAVHLQILEIISIPETKDNYDQAYLKIKIGESQIANLVWKSQRHEFVDYYKQFNIDTDTPTKQIQYKLKKLSMKLHPDRQGNKEQFEILNDAKYILTNEPARHYYNIIHNKFYSALTFLQEDETNPKEEESIQRNKNKTEDRQIFIKNFNSEIKILKDAIKHFGRIEKIAKLGQKMFLVTMKSTGGATMVINNLNGRKIGKHKIKAEPYKSKEQMNRERMEKEEQERTNRAQTFEDYDMSDVEVLWVSSN